MRLVPDKQMIMNTDRSSNLPEIKVTEINKNQKCIICTNQNAFILCEESDKCDNKFCMDC
jgi:hypothetical protein